MTEATEVDRWQISTVSAELLPSVAAFVEKMAKRRFRVREDEQDRHALNELLVWLERNATIHNAFPCLLSALS